MTTPKMPTDPTAQPVQPAVTLTDPFTAASASPAAKPAMKPAPAEAARVENTTDATQGEPLAVRARTRKAELEALLTTMPAHDEATRADIERALSSLAPLLTGDSANPSATTAAELSRWLEGSKHLGETAAKTPPKVRH